MPDFKLSAILPHEKLIRTISSTASWDVVTCSEDGQVFLWRTKNTESQEPSWVKKKVISDLHGKGKMVFCLKRLLLFRSPESKDKNFFVSGGTDCKARVWDIEGNEYLILEGHSGSVISVEECGSSKFLTGSFDSTAKYWVENKAVLSLSESNQYGVQVSLLRSGKVVTGSFKTLVIWNKDKVHKKIVDAHSHSIRKIIPIEENFASCSNDGFVKIWSEEGECLLKINAHPVEGNLDSFVYSIAYSPEHRELVSVGENGSCCIWDLNGNLKQRLLHPSYIREVALLDNSDILTTNGNNVFVYSKDPQRKAPQSVMKEFKSLFEKKSETFKTCDKSVLKAPGKFNGQTLVVDEEGEQAVYTWDAPLDSWTYIGKAIAEEENKKRTTLSEKKILNGKEYDHIAHITYNDGPEIELGVNRDDDPKEVAEKFCASHMLDASNVIQVANHIAQFTDPAALARKRKAQQFAKFEELKTLPVWVRGKMEISAACRPAAMQQKILEFNAALVGTGMDIEQSVLDSLFALLKDSSDFHVGVFGEQRRNGVLSLLFWPRDKLFPVLDALRLFMCHSDFVERFWRDADLRETVFKRVRDVEADLVMEALFCKVFSNFVAKRNKTNEMKEEKAIAKSVFEIALELNPFGKYGNTLDTKSPEKNKKMYVNSYLVLVNNILIWLGKCELLKKEDCETLITSLLSLLEHVEDEKAKRFALLAIGSVCLVLSKNLTDPVTSEEIKKILKCKRGMLDPNKSSSKGQGPTGHIGKALASEVWNVVEFCLGE